MKQGITIDIPRFGSRYIKTIVNYTGTHSRGGKLVPGVRHRLIRLATLVDIVVRPRRAGHFPVAVELVRWLHRPPIHCKMAGQPQRLIDDTYERLTAIGFGYDENRPP
jgi:hypothetical protein